MISSCWNISIQSDNRMSTCTNVTSMVMGLPLGKYMRTINLPLLPLSSSPNFYVRWWSNCCIIRLLFFPYTLAWSNRNTDSSAAESIQAPSKGSTLYSFLTPLKFPIFIVYTWRTARFSDSITDSESSKDFSFAEPFSSSETWNGVVSVLNQLKYPSSVIFRHQKCVVSKYLLEIGNISLICNFSSSEICSVDLSSW